MEPPTSGLMKELSFFFYEVHVAVSVPEDWPSLSSFLEEDFRYFRQERGAEIRHRVRIRIFDEVRPMPGLFPFPACRVKGWWKKRSCFYKDGSFVDFRIRGNEREARIGAGDCAGAYMRAYYFILSAVGELLEREGWQRLHSLSFKRNADPTTGTTLAILPSGWGKSTMAALLLKNGKAQILSDEVGLFKNGLLRPFPLRLALNAESLQLVHHDMRELRELPQSRPLKYALAIPEERIPVGEQPLEGVIFGCDPQRWGSRWRFGVEFVLGVGLAQMAEYLLRWDQIIPLMGTAIARWKLLGDLRGHPCAVEKNREEVRDAILMGNGS